MNKSLSQGTGSAALDRDCTQTCRSKQHAAQCVAAATRRGVSDRQLASYLYRLCANFAKKQDDVGRSVLHTAASCGKHELCQWLVTYAGSNPNCRDHESGYTALHRAVYYGHVHTAVRLLQVGASLDVCDNEDMTVVDMLCKEQALVDNLSLSSQCQPYVWGVNKNYSLGTGSDDTRKIPELLEFTKHSVSIIQVALEELHSVYVSSCGRVWSCGMGQTGRLGSGSSNSLLTPQPVRIGRDKCVAAAVAINHTLLLLDNHTVRSFGSNREHQLGVYPYVECCLAPQQVYHSNFTSSHPIAGVLAAKYHSVFYSDTAVYTCGLNAGQLGRSPNPASPYITQPAKVPLMLNGRTITHVACCLGAIVVAVSNGDIYVVHKFLCKKMTSKLLDVVKIGCIGGSLVSEGLAEPTSELRVVILNSRGSILLWMEGAQQPTRCVFSTKQSINVNDFCLTQHHVLLVTKDGTAFQGSFVAMPPVNVLSGGEKSAGSSRGHQFHKFVEKSECYSVKLKQLPNIFRGVTITADPRGNNFAVIQTHPKSALTDIPTVSDSEMPGQMAVLLEEASESDLVHDAEIKVCGRVFPVHRFILNRAGGQLYEKTLEDTTLILTDTNAYIVEQVLVFLYTGSCSLLQPGPFDVKKIAKREDPLKLALDLCNRYKIQALSRKLHKLKYEGGKILVKESCELLHPERIEFDRKTGTEVYDVTLKSEDGSVIKAHKCVLVARLDYFHSMFLGGWAETGRDCVLPLPFSFRVLKDLIDFIYTDGIPDHLSSDEDLDHVIRLLIAGDQLLVKRLKECCELVLIGALTLRNAPTVLHLASVYNCPQLKASTIQFVSLNLASFLQTRVLEVLEDDVLVELSDYYKELSGKKYRVMTPLPLAPSEDQVASVPLLPWPESFSLDQKIEMPADVISPPSASKKKKSGGKKSLPSAVEGLALSDTIEVPQPPPVSHPVNEDSRMEMEVPVETKESNKTPSVTSFKQDDIIDRWADTQFPLLDSGKHKTRVLHPPQNKLESSRKLFSPPTKLSQKERKRLSSESERQQESRAKAAAASPPTPKPVRTWATLPPIPTTNNECTSRDSFSEDTNFVDIMAHDKQKKVNLAKMKSKPFHLTQLEEKAIDELMSFYNAASECDERITVHRVYSQDMDSPQWIKQVHP